MSLLDVIYPRRCHLCGGSLDRDERYLCRYCCDTLPRTYYHSLTGNSLERRLEGIIHYERAAGHFFYARGSEMAQLMHDLKYRGYAGLGRYLGEIVGNEIYTTGFLADVESIVPVPMHRFKQARRGYNQAVEIAKGIGRATGIPVEELLESPRRHGTQTALGRQQRLANAAGKFRVKDPKRIDGRHLLLVDDVCTTGATLISAATELLQVSSTTRVSIYTLAVTF